MIRRPLVFLVAGEPSGDAIGSKLMRALKRERGGLGELDFAGIGGEAMQAEGLQSLFPMDELTVMGFAEVVPRLPSLRRRLHETIAAVGELRPHVVLGIDSKAFCLRLLRAVADAHGPGSGGSDGAANTRPSLLQYVAPSAWAFRDAERRASQLVGGVDELLALLPFEPPLFEGAGVPCTFVGHPSLEDGAALLPPTATQRRTTAAPLLRRLGLHADAPTLCLLPGSRPQEVRCTLPHMLQAAELMAAALPPQPSPPPAAPSLQLLLAAPPALRPLVEETIEAQQRQQRRRMEREHLSVAVVGSDERYEAYAASDLALACSGTVNVELALRGVPQLALYRTSWLTSVYVRAVLRPAISHATLPNLISGREIVPELLFERCAAEPVAAAALEMLRRPATGDEQLAALREEVLPRLGVRDAAGALVPPSTVAARAVLRHLAPQGVT